MKNQPETFTFNVNMNIDIKANDISEAIRLFHETYPNIKPGSINHIDTDSKRMGYELSLETGERIYFRPGCPCGYNDCILDPMTDIAESCAHQSDMTTDKWVCCGVIEEDEEYCSQYDDENK